MSGTVGRVPTPPPPMSGAGGAVPPHPWADTPLGPPHSWDPSLRTVVDLILGAPVPMALSYGEDLRLFYNNRYAELLGDQHPSAFGQPVAEVFAEIWEASEIGELVDRVYRDGEAYVQRETTLPASRESGPPVVIAHGHSPVRDHAGQIIGILTVATEANQLTRQLQSLGELSAALAGTLTLDDVARVSLRHAIAVFAAESVAFGVDEGPGWRVVRRIRGEVLDEADERLPPLWRRWPAGSPAPLLTTADSGIPHYTSDGQPLLATALDRHDQRIRALAALPLRTSSLRGAITVAHRNAHTWSPAERALLSATAELVAQAAERARRFETQHGTAQLLQRSMLPENLPDLPQLRVAARYEPGVDGNAAGGDFYDAFHLPSGGLGIVLGDVAGHDVQAAARMGQVRAALRALALSDPRPHAVLTGLDRLVSSLGAEGRTEELFVTVVFGVVEPNRERLTLASAGHPAPLVRRCDRAGQPGTHYLDVPPGPPLGLGGERSSTSVEFLPGDTLLMFSDGVVERRQHSLEDGLRRLADAVAAATSGDPRALCAVASAAMPDTTEDDVAVLAVEHVVVPSRSASLQVPAEPTAPSRVRHWLADQLRGWQVSESVIGPALLCVSELTTNALLHAGTDARVDVDLSAERLLVSVSDRGTRGAVTRTQADPLSSRGRGLGLIEQLSDAWGTDPTVRGSTVWFELLVAGR